MSEVVPVQEVPALDLEFLATDVVELAVKAGASDAEVVIREGDEFSVNVRLGQPAEVTIDAIPKKIFHGKVSEIGDNAIVRSSGVSTSQQATASEEAKDFKVVVTLSDPPTTRGPARCVSHCATESPCKDAPPSASFQSPKWKRRLCLPASTSMRSVLSSCQAI